MNSDMMRGVRRSLWLLAAGTMWGSGAPASAQRSAYPPGAVVQPLPAQDDGAELRRHLADLAANPRSVASLIGAGRAALVVGDGQAALGFFARAEEIAPRDARAKAGMASAFVQLEQPQAALRFFADAVALGAPEVEIARDRGLAYDMLGNPRRAQQDYTLVLQRGDDAEVRRRLALSLAVSGNRDAALRTLDPLLRRNDRAAQRTRAFVLALTGDANGATQAVNAAMPGQGQAMAPFLSRLAALNPAQKAMAVHFGRFPADGRPVQMAEAVDTSAHPAAVAMTGDGRPATAQPRFGRQVQPAPAASQPVVRRRIPPPLQAGTDPRRRPGTAEPAANDRAEGRQPLRPVRSQPTQPTRTATPSPARTVPAPERQPVQIARNEVITSSPQPQRTVPAEPPAPSPQPGFDSAPAPVPATGGVRPVELPAARIEDPTAPPAIAPTNVERTTPAFADVAALIESLPTETAAATPSPPRPSPATGTNRPQARAATPAARPTRTAAATPRPAATRARTQPAAPAHPSRHWVQIAGGNRGAFAYELGRIRRAAPELLRNRSAYWAVNGNSNRLLVGPFASPAEARAFVTSLSREDVPAFAWTSQAGEEVARLPAR